MPRTLRRPARLTLALALVLPSALAGCTDDTTAEPEDEPEVVYRYAYATGIRMTRLLVNQAVEVELVEGNELRDPSEYPVPLLEGRPSLVQAHFVIHADFEPRELLAQLSVTYPEPITIGSGDDAETLDSYVDESRVFVERSSVIGSLTRSFAWYLPAAYVVDGMRLRVDVYEPEPYEDPEQVPTADPDAVGAERIDAPALPWASPAATFVADTTPMELEVVLVPIEHHFEDCVSDAAVPPEEVDPMRWELEQNNPVQRAKFSVREPMVYTDPIGGSEMAFSPILSKLAQLRADDGVEPWVYYYGLITTCDGYPGGLLGQAHGIPQAIDPGLGHMRVSVGRYNGSGAAAAETFVHEVGHSQGRRHVRCAGNEAGVEPDYPHIGGIIGAWGFGIHDVRMRSPTGARDYMTYCSNEWVSDYGYNKVWEVIRTLTQWSIEGIPETSEGFRSASFDEILIGALYVDGSIEWWTTPGSIHGDMSAEASIEWELGGEHLRLPVWVSPRGDDETLNLMSVLPAGGLDGARFAFELDAADLEGIVPLGQGVEFDALHRAGR
jgi:hypothetical protein